MKNFFNDKDGFTIKDYEKFLLGLAFIILTSAITYMYIKYKFINMIIVYFTLGIASLFVGSKWLNYHYNIKSMSIQDNNINSVNNTNNINNQDNLPIQ